MKFYITRYFENNGREYTGEYEYPHMKLVTDSCYDNFEYETLFKLKYCISKGFSWNIGEIKIMKLIYYLI